MSLQVRFRAAAVAALLLPFVASAQTQLAPRPTIAAATPRATATSQLSLAENLAAPTPTALALPTAWSGATSDRTDSLMSQWDAAFRVTVRRNCFRGEENPAVAMVNMLGLLAQSQAVAAEDRDAVSSAVHRAWYDVVNNGGCAGLEAPPYQVIASLDGVEWLSKPQPAKDARVERDEAGRVVAVETQVSDYGQSLARRWRFEGAAGAERLTGAEDVMRSSTRGCVMDMANLVTAIAARYPSLVPQRSYHLEGQPADDQSPCARFAAGAAAGGRWSVEYLNPRTGLVEVAVELRQASHGELDAVVRYPGVGYQ